MGRADKEVGSIPQDAPPQVDADFRRHIYPQKIKYHIYHGPARTKTSADLLASDIVLTTYDTVAASATKIRTKSTGESPSLHACEWHRIVLDEGEQRAESCWRSLTELLSKRMSSVMLSQSDTMLC